MTYDGAYYRDIGNLLRERYESYGFTKGTVQEVDFLLDVLQLPLGSRVLDLGCGPGRHALEMARRGYRVAGIDITPAFVEIASKRAEAEELDATFICQDARDPFPIRDLDGAICVCEGGFGLAGGDENHLQILRHMHDALRPGAPFVLTAFSGYGAARRSTSSDELDAESGVVVEHERVTLGTGDVHDLTYYTTTFTVRELRALLAGSGFAVEDVWGCMPGAFARRPLALDDYEFMVVARR